MHAFLDFKATSFNVRVPLTDLAVAIAWFQAVFQRAEQRI
jgi:hypothetical protein